MKKAAAALCASAVGVFCVLLYIPSWTNPFVLDDVAKIETNPDLRLPWSLGLFFYPYTKNAGEFRNDPSRPLTFMVYWFCWHAGSGSPVPFRVVTTLLHAVAAILVGWLAAAAVGQFFRIKPPPAVFGIAAVLFSTSPLVAGTVVYAYGLSDVLSSVLLLAALVLLIRTPQPGPAAQAAAAGLFLLALGAKQSAIVLPALVVAWDLLTGGPAEMKQRIRLYVPLVLVAISYLAAREFLFGRLGDLEGGQAVRLAGSYAGMQGAVILSYLKLLAVPSGLSIDHLPAAASFPPWLRLTAWAVVAALSVLAVKAGFERTSRPLRRLAGLGWLIFVIALLPTSSIVPTVDLMVERRAYFAAVGVFIAVAGTGWSLARRSRAWRSALLLVVLLAVVSQSAVTWHRHAVYGSPEALWKESLALNPLNRRALANLGTYYSRVGRWEDAVQAFEKILAANPQDGPAWTKLAYVLAQPGYAGRDDRKAIEALERGLALNPTNFLGFFNKAIILLRTGRTGEAEDALRRAVALSPRYVPAHFMLGEVALQAGRTDEARAHFREVLRLNPGDAAATARLRDLEER
jgi:tetratricopeptide (TPR) repeat protein